MSDFETEARKDVCGPPEVDRDLMLTKVDALLGFLSLRLSRPKPPIGFNG
jgi:hypothetical protein